MSRTPREEPPISAPSILRRALPVALLVLLVGGTAVAHPPGQSSLEEAERRVEEVAGELEAARGRADDARASLQRVDERLAAAEEAVNEVARELQRQREKVQQAAGELQRLRREARRLRSQFQSRAVSLFKSGGGQPLELLLASGGVQDAVDRSAYIQVLSNGQTASLEAVRANRVAVAEQRRYLDTEREHLEEMKQDREALLARVQEIHDARAARFASVRDQVSELAAHKEDLEADAERIERLIRQRQASAGSVGSPSTAGYIWPACGAVTSEYGYRWGRLHAGLDIDDPPTGIRAAKSGVVIFADYQGGYGRLTLIDHGDGVVTGYAHQSQQHVAEGQRVQRGEAIGVIGATGNVTGTHLHFETRVNGSAVNPRRFLPGGRC